MRIKNLFDSKWPPLQPQKPSPKSTNLKNPLKTKFLKPILKNEDPKAVNKMKKDLLHIKSYLIRKKYYFESDENNESWLKFINMSFFDFLEDVGMFTDQMR